MPKAKKKKLPKKVGATVPGRGKIKRIRTVSLNGKYIKVGVVSKKGPRGGMTVAGPVRKKKKKQKH